MNFDILDPTKIPNWDDILLNSPGYSFFHSSSWAKVLSESYSYKPFYFSAIENGRFKALVPVMEVNSFLTGKRGVSLPFTDYCEPIVGEGINFAEIFAEMTTFGKKRGWKYLELRGGSRFMQDSGNRSQESAIRAGGENPKPEPSRLTPRASRLTPDGSVNLKPETRSLEPGFSRLAPHGTTALTAASRESQGARGSNPEIGISSQTPNASRLTPNGIVPFVTYLGYTLDLRKSEEALFKSLRDSTRRNISKAAKQNVAVKISQDPQDMREFYRLNCLTRKEHGLPPQPYYFFEKLQKHVISVGNGFVALGMHKSRAIAGNVFLQFGTGAIYKYGASEKINWDLRANNLVMWEGIKRLRDQGCETFSFGRTERENLGLQQFKKGWGGEEYAIAYFRFDFRQMTFVSNHSHNDVTSKILHAVPQPLLNFIGSALYKHVG